MEILYRLLGKQEDGFRVMGYEKHESGKIYHMRGFDGSWRDILSYTINEANTAARALCYVTHDRKDQFVIKIGTDIIFERDEVLLTASDSFSNNNISIDYGGTYEGTVRMMDGFWGVMQKDNTTITLSDIINDEIEFTEILGVEGVTAQWHGTTNRTVL